MRQSDPRGSLATRDIVARAIDKELKRSGKHEVLLITEHLDSEHLANRFPNIANRMNKNGIQIGIDPIPVAPAAHYIVGGLAVNEWGEVLQRNLQTDKQTSSPQEGKILQGLFAIGEVACTGLHGANRLASNSLLEAVVFSHRAGIRVIEWLNQEATNDSKLPNWRADGLTSLEEHTPLVHDKNELRSTMSDDVGIVKNNWRLSRAERRLSLLDKEVELIWQSCKPTKELVELRNMIQLGQMVIRASIQRKENIGLHYNLNLT